MLVNAVLHDRNQLCSGVTIRLREMHIFSFIWMVMLYEESNCEMMNSAEELIFIVMRVYPIWW